MTPGHWRRLEDPPLVTGEGRFIADLVDEHTLACVFVRSPIAHGTFSPPPLDEARRMPGVVDIFTNESLGLPDMPSSPGRGAPEATGMGQPTLARERVRFVGEPVAVVVGETARLAADAAEQVWLDIDPLPAVNDVATALADGVLLFPETGTNLVHQAEVGATEPKPEVAREVTVEVVVPRLSPVTIEPLAILARPVANGLEIWCGHQAPARLPQQLGSMIGLAPESIRVRVPDVGGAFGTKGQFYPEYVVVTAIAHRLQRPAAWIETRGEQMRGGTHGRGQSISVRIGGDAAGRIKSIEMDIRGEVGAYPSTGSRIPFFTQSLSQGLYDVAYHRARALAVVTNRAPTGPYRGAGRPEAALAIERAVDEFAVDLGLAPEEVRRRSLISAGSLPYKTHTGLTYDSGDYPAALELALKTADVDGWREEQERRRREGGRPIGVGIATFVERAGGAVGLGEYGRVELVEDGILVVRTGSTASGQSHRTVWSQVAAGVFDITMDKVRFFAGDTGEVSAGVGSFGSRSAQTGAAAIFRSAQRVREKALKVAEQLLEASAADLEIVGGAVRVVGAAGTEVPLASVVRAAADAGIELVDEEMYVPDAITFPYGAYVAVVEVDTETGQVDLLRLVAVDDCGVRLNPMVVEGQVHGSAMQGLGAALLEEIRYDDDGQLLTANLMNYLIPTATQPFPLVTETLTNPTPVNPLGAKGSGETGCIGVPPAMLNAVLDALRPYGVTSLDLPLTSHRVWQAIERARPTSGARP